ARSRVRGGLIPLAVHLSALVAGCREPERPPLDSVASTGDDTASAGVSAASDPSSSSRDQSSGSSTTIGAGEESAAGRTDDTSGGDSPTPVAPLEEGELRPGGDTTVDEIGIGAFVQRAANLSILDASDFEAGVQFVQLAWEAAP